MQCNAMQWNSIQQWNAGNIWHPPLHPGWICCLSQWVVQGRLEDGRDDDGCDCYDDDDGHYDDNVKHFNKNYTFAILVDFSVFDMPNQSSSAYWQKSLDICQSICAKPNKTPNQIKQKQNLLNHLGSTCLPFGKVPQPCPIHKDASVGQPIAINQSLK